MTKGTEILPLERSPARTSLSSPRMGLQPGRRLISTSVGCKDNGNDGTYANMDLRSHVRGCARIVAQRLRVTGVGGVGGVAQGTLLKSKKSSRSGCTASRAVRCALGPMKRFSTNLITAVWSIGNMRNIMPPGERRDHNVGQAEANLRRKAMHRRRIAGVGSRDNSVADRNAAVAGGVAGHTGEIVIGIHGNGSDIRNRPHAMHR